MQDTTQAALSTIQIFENTSQLMRMLGSLLLFFFILCAAILFWSLWQKRHELFPQKPAHQTKEDLEKISQKVVTRVLIND